MLAGSQGTACSGRPASCSSSGSSMLGLTRQRAGTVAVWRADHAPLRRGTALRQWRPSTGVPGGAPARLVAVGASQPDTEEARSPADAPQEWEAPQPSRRPDIFPEFEKMERVFLPKPLPGDPEMPDEEAEEAVKRTEPGDPDPEAPPGEPSEPEPGPGEDPMSPEKKDPSIPSAPE